MPKYTYAELEESSAAIRYIEHYAEQVSWRYGALFPDNDRDQTISEVRKSLTNLKHAVECATLALYALDGAAF